MSFLQPLLLAGLPLALLPLIIHLINRHRHRTVEWAAMLFLLDARKMNKGMARLRQILILAMRVLAVAMLIFAASRPLSGGIFALTGGKADTVIVLLDRSASMEQQILETGESKRLAALDKLTDLLEKTGQSSEIVLIDSATLKPVVIDDSTNLAELPQTDATSTAADIPALLQIAIDYLVTNESGRTDIWVASDQRKSDWNPASGRWQSLRTKLAAQDNVRLFLLNFPEASKSNYSIQASNVQRIRTPENLQLIFDLRVGRESVDEPLEEVTLPVDFIINGTRTVQEVTLIDREAVLQGHTISLGNSDERGWGRVSLPADDNPRDNISYLVFDDPAPRKTVIVSDDPDSRDAIIAAAKAPVEIGATYDAIALDETAAAQVPWQETALLFWHAPLPSPDSTEATLLTQHVKSGRTLIFLPPETSEVGERLFGFSWGKWQESSRTPLEVGWWRTESELLANTRNGAPLPLGDLKLFKTRLYKSESQPLLKLESGEPVISKLITDHLGPTAGNIYIWGTLPRTDHSTFATDGVAFFVMLHRALDQGVNSVSRAQSRDACDGTLPAVNALKSLSSPDQSPLHPDLHAGAYEVTPLRGDPLLFALNRPNSEDSAKTLTSEGIKSLLEGVDYRQISDELGSGSSLAAEVWRAFLLAMALALIVEAALCLPPKPEPESLPLHLSPPARQSS